jgi:hypothetical protein
MGKIACNSYFLLLVAVIPFGGKAQHPFKYGSLYKTMYAKEF